MPIQAPSWTDFLSCPICCNEFASSQRLPISLGCGHTICRLCLATLHNRQCPFDQTAIISDVDSLPINNALLQLVNTVSDNNVNDGNNKKGADTIAKANNTIALEENAQGAVATGVEPSSVRRLDEEDLELYKSCRTYIENLALQLKCPGTNSATSFSNILSRPMQRKLVTLINCQLMEEEGRVRALRAARSLGERTVMELILQHQNAQLLSSNLWAAVRSRGCQFLGPSMQEEVLKLVLLALEDGSALSRKVLVMFVVQRLEPHFPQASKTSIGHVVQLLYRASCFKVSKREADSSLMQLKEEFRTYEALRREHDAQIVQIATEAGLRIAPDQWSSLLYGDTMHKSHMQSISDKLQTPSSFAQAVQELVIALQRTGDPANLSVLRSHLKHLAGIEPNTETEPPSWEDLATALNSVRLVVLGLVDFLQHHGSRKLQETTSGPSSSNHKYKISLCRDLAVRQVCPRGTSCTFAHSEEELERYRAKNRKSTKSTGHNSISFKKTSQLHPNPHQNHQSPHRVGFNHSEETISPTLSTHSPLRFTSSNLCKLASKNFMEATSPIHNLHGQSSLGTHHRNQPPLPSPIPPTNGQMMGNAPPPPSPIVVPPMHQRFEAPFTPLNYPKPPMPVMTSIGVTTALSPLSFTGSVKHGARPPTANMTTVNPPKFPDNAPLNNNGLYNMIANDLYHASYKAGLPNVNPQHIPGLHPNQFFVGGNGDNNPAVDYPASRKSPQNPIWDQQQRLSIMGSMPNISNADYLRFPQMPYRQSPGDGPFFCNNKINTPGMEQLEKPRNGMDAHDFKNEFGIRSFSGVNSNSTNNNNNCFYNGTQTSPREQSYSCSVGDGNDNVTRSFFMSNGTEVGTAANAVGGGGGGLRSSLSYFCDRDNFVRSDSILDDDGTSYDVSTSTPSFESKFGPICPMYKDSATAESIAAARPQNFADNWSGAVPEANIALMAEQNIDLKYSVFPEAERGSELVKTLKYSLEKPCMHNMEVVFSNLSKLHFNVNNAEPPNVSRGTENTNGCNLGLNPINMMGYMDNSGGNVGTQASSLNGAFQWTPFANLDSNCIWNRSSTPPSLVKVGEVNSNLPLKEQQQEQQIKQVHQQQQHAVKPPLLQTSLTAAGPEEGSESGIDNIMMRDIEQKLVEIVEKVWSSSDDSGIKLDGEM